MEGCEKRSDLVLKTHSITTSRTSHTQLAYIEKNENRRKQQKEKAFISDNEKDTAENDEKSRLRHKKRGEENKLRRGKRETKRREAKGGEMRRKGRRDGHGTREQ